MTAAADHEYLLLDLIRSRRFVRAKDLDALGIPRVYLTRMLRAGRIERIAHGLYEGVNAPHFAERDLALACALYPKSAICLLSGAYFHGWLPQNPRETWVTREPGTPKPRAGSAGLRIESVYMSGRLLEDEVEHHERHGAAIRVTSKEKTLVDMFRYRERVDQELALELLADHLDENVENPDATDALLEVAATHRMRRTIQENIDHLNEQRASPGPRLPSAPTL